MSPTLLSIQHRRLHPLPESSHARAQTHYRLNARIKALAISLLLLSACISLPAPVTPTTPPMQGTPGLSHVQLSIYPDDDEQQLLDRIAAARQRVWMTMYLLTDMRVVDALVSAQQNSADVRVLLEPNPYGSVSSGGQAFISLMNKGVRVKYSNPAFRYTHQKSSIIDQTSIILTANMTRAAFTRNREFVLVDNAREDVDEVAAAFEADWNRTAFSPSSVNLVWSPHNSRDRIGSVINAAQHSLNVYAEVVQDTGQAALLTEAVQRGVRVRLITSPPDPGNGADDNAPGLDQLQRGGVKVRYLKTPYIHAKMMVADGVYGFAGSENISTGSLEFNRELGVLITDPTALVRMNQTFDHDWDKAMDR